MTAPLPNLTKNQSLVFETLAEAGAPLSAYTILDQLREHGFRAPLQVYRALDKLLERGLIHRLESLNAFVACQHKHSHGHQGATVFVICGTCGDVNELHDQVINDQIMRRAVEQKFQVESAMVELRGRCSGCAD
ncbi:Fur family transcriptional regulator [Denitrobaculum tricleocarpae]|uniref:Transcriptional repressor n=1 Tax=Denitrobaculum tricleocarpae TaxID=2591009 RepID=A0A545SZA0_9PROT|nr:Fur family transcriptional regulator [Denitrobaculum tricleocarpae]TQV70294.1 transcriptional repressor [Denitrobaculum tricleocarpae]